MEKSHIERLTYLGLHFGYPECCIDYFLLRMSKILKGEKIPFPKGPWCKFAFLPCSTHMEIIKNSSFKEFTETIIIKNRTCDTPFGKTICALDNCDGFKKMKKDKMKV